MLVIIKKPFLYAHDGIHIEELAAGSRREIADSVFEGLCAAGYIEQAATAPSADERHNSAALSVRHIGRGKYDLFLGEERYTRDAMTKEEADAALAALGNT